MTARPLTVEQRLRRAELALRIILTWAAEEGRDKTNPRYWAAAMRDIEDAAAKGLGRDDLRVKK